MNEKDLQKLTLGVTPDASDIMIHRPHPSGDGRTLLNKSVKSEFMHCMTHFLNIKSEGGVKPVVINLNGKPAFRIRIEEWTPEEEKEQAPVIPLTTRL